ncbi:MAG TPA: phosphate propanoyltransferase [Vicinamibacterales bacterium]|nr:phosphate propanoyltransferase [Vicinamibacterales bacterium]
MSKSLEHVPVAVSARHVHLTLQATEALFGKGHQLHKLRDLSQPGVWAAVETVDILGPRGSIEGVRVLGPCREENQVEVSLTDSIALGIDVPVRMSGDLRDTPRVTLRGPSATTETTGLIAARRHIHMGLEEAEARGMADGDLVDVEVGAQGRTTLLRDVIIRTSPNFLLEMHVDTDEANAAGLVHGGIGELSRAHCSARMTNCRCASRP